MQLRAIPLLLEWSLMCQRPTVCLMSLRNCRVKLLPSPFKKVRQYSKHDHETCHAPFPRMPSRCSWDPNMLQSKRMKVRPALVRRLQATCRKSMPPDASTCLPKPAQPPADPQSREDVQCENLTESACFVTHGSSGIVDLGASTSVIGQQQFQELCKHLPRHVRSRMMQAPCAVNFRFGNDSNVTGRRAIFLPLANSGLR